MGQKVMYLKISDEDNYKTYDGCVIGSDEVFNCNVASPWGFTSQLFGNIRQASNVITYAASCGSTQYENVPSDVRMRIENAFKRVKSFSVRDSLKRTNSRIAFTVPSTPSLLLFKQRSYDFASPHSLFV